MSEINLGRLPRPMGLGDIDLMREKFSEGRIFPHDSVGYFTDDGIFNLVHQEGGRDIWGEARFKVEKLWSANLLGLDAMNMRLAKTLSGLIVYQGNHHNVVTPVGVEDLRLYSGSHSGKTTVSEDGYVLEPGVLGEHFINGSYLTHDEVLAEIRKGRASERCYDCGQSFERVVDLSLVGQSVQYLHLKTPCDREDPVVLHNGKLVERVRVFPWISRYIFEHYYD
ncbi:MAG: hypothetical protein Q7S44_02625 [bacterium]|nr:hypothetical protein [bacterium]